MRAAQVQGLPVGRLIVGFTALAGSLRRARRHVRGRRGAGQRQRLARRGLRLSPASSSPSSPGTIRSPSFRSRSCFGGIDASGGLIQRRMDLPDATVLVLQGIALRRHPVQRDASTAASRSSIPICGRGAPDGRRPTSACGACRSPSSAAPSASRRPSSSSRSARRITENSGRINLGLEGTLVLRRDDRLCGRRHDRLALARRARGRRRRRAASACSTAGSANFPKVNDIAIGIALMLFGIGPRLLLRQALHPAVGAATCRPSRSAAGPAIPQVQAALKINPLFLVGVALAVVPVVGVQATRAAGLIVRMSATVRDAGARHGRLGSTRCASSRPRVGGFLAGVGGAFLSLYYPGSWSEGLSSGQGLMAVALVIFARWNPLGCFARGAAVRRRRRARPGAAIGRRHAGLLLVQRRALHPDASHHDRHLVARAARCRRARRTVDHQMSHRERMH